MEKKQPNRETVLEVIEHLKDKGYTIYPPASDSPMQVWVRKASAQKPFSRVSQDSLGDVNALRDVGRAFITLVPAVMETGMTLIDAYEGTPADLASLQKAFEDVNTAVVAIYNTAINNGKCIPDLLQQLNAMAMEDPWMQHAYSLYSFLFLQHFLAYNLVAFPVLFGLAEYDPEELAQYNSALVTMGFVEEPELRRKLVNTFKNIGSIPTGLSTASLTKAGEDLAALVKQEAVYRAKKQQEANVLID